MKIITKLASMLGFAAAVTPQPAPRSYTLTGKRLSDVALYDRPPIKYRIRGRITKGAFGQSAEQSRINKLNRAKA